MCKTVRKGDPAKALVRRENAPVPKKIPKGCVPVKDSLHRLSAYLNLLRRQQVQTDLINPNSFFKLMRTEAHGSTQSHGSGVWVDSCGRVAQERPSRRVFLRMKLPESLGVYAVQFAKVLECKVYDSTSGKNDPSPKRVWASKRTVCINR